ncbi:glycosyltransferase family 4 protein [Flagellimonas sp.]|uniref:glycosyltransferase family 4 protein n=1 Tax=Flagellimonas sp. TaxID=2058762 RepID=UPI003AB4FDFB
MSQFYEVIGISSSGKPPITLENVGDKEEVRVIPVEMSRKITFLKDIKGVFQLCRIFLKEKPCIVHTHTPKAGLLGMIAAYLTRVPYRLHTVAGMPLLEATGNKRKLLDLVEKLTYYCATHVYPNSYGLKDIIIEGKYAPSKKVKVIGDGSSNGIDTTYFDPNIYRKEDIQSLATSIGIPEDDFVFVFVGRLVRDKGINELINAFTNLQQDSPNITLLLVGGFEKELDPLLPETLTLMETNEKIIATGWQNDVRPYLAMADALVFPSYREGFPNAVLQAAAMGLPSVVSNINGCNEIIQNGKNGIIIPTKNVGALQEAMMSMIHNNGAVQLDSQAIREQIEMRYNRRVVCEKILEEYRSFKA